MIGRRQEAGAFKFRSAGEVNFLFQCSSYFSRLKELGEEGPAHGLCIGQIEAQHAPPGNPPGN